jgi:NAD(P)-dependent dehydrogenase (short-subunit alcohol dehydrogenase family)
MGSLEGKVVAVTGGGRGIGRAIAERAAREGARIVVIDPGGSLRTGREDDAAVAEEVADGIRQAGGSAVPTFEDVSSLAGAGRACDVAIDNFGRLDGLVCCAGNLLNNGVCETTEAEWDDVMRVHLRGHFACTQAAARVMKRQGSGQIIYFSSASAVVGPAYQAAYSAAKAGILGLLLSSARALEPHGIAVNCILPGAATRMTDMLWSEREAPADGGRQADLAMRSDQAGGTWRDPANIAPFAVYLLSGRAGGMTAQTFAVVGYQVTAVNPLSYGETIRSDGPWDLNELAERAAGLSRIAPPSLASWPP